MFISCMYWKRGFVKHEEPENEMNVIIRTQEGISVINVNMTETLQPY